LPATGLRLPSWGQIASPLPHGHARRIAAIGAIATVVLGTGLWAFAFTRIYTHPHSRVEASRWIYQNIPAGAAITSEVWDDALPLYLDGRDASQYVGIALQPYAEDEPSKYFGYTDGDGLPQPGLLDQLDQADYLIFSSNRVYDSTRRLPMKYPALIRYWNALFEGQLGFELVADIRSYPTLFGIEIATPVLAEEAFSVYDHPRVLIFKKTPAYTRANAEAQITDGIAWEEVYKGTSQVGGNVPTALRLTTDQWQSYRDGGANVLPSLFGSVAPWLAWLVALELIGFAAFALLFHALPQLPDRGYSLAKTLGLLVVAWLAWLLASLGPRNGWPLMSFSPLSVWLCAAVLIVPGAIVGWRSRAQLRVFFQARRTALLTAEGLFLVAFVGFLIIRALNPDLWHDARGGEKPMDLAYLTATLRSAAFPPYDPWFAGGYINYYYFGFVFVGTLVHLSGVAPTVAYNLAVPTIFALTALGAFGVTYNLLARRRTENKEQRTKNKEPQNRRTVEPEDNQQQNTHHATRTTNRRAIAAGLLAALFVTTLGPLTQAAWFLPGSADQGDMGISEECRLESSYAAQQDCRGRNEWAFWDATRAVGMAISKQTGNYDGTISEFPFFTFLFADLHAHMIALPIALLTLGLSLALIRTGNARTGNYRTENRRIGSLFVVLCSLALAIGALAATNTWDYPTYLGLGVLMLGLVWGRRWQRGTPLLAALANWALWAGGLVLLSRLLFLPFHQSFATEYAGFELWSGPRTGAAEFLKINGLWLFLLLAGLLLIQRRRGTSLLTLVLCGLATIVLCLAAAFGGWPALVLIVPMLGVAIGTLIDLLFRERSGGEMVPSVATVVPALWACAALGLCLLSELIVAKGDIGRMNTVFKLGMQSWTLFALVSAITFTGIFLPRRARRPEGEQPILAFSPQPSALVSSGVFAFFALFAVRSAAVALVLAALVYPLTATPARLADRFDRAIAPTLDGTAYMSSPKARWGENGQTFSFAEDADALDWVRRNIVGAPVMLEAQSEVYRWAGRVSVYTGLPTVLGWPWHQTQQRAVTRVQPILEARRNLVPQLYTDPDAQATLAKLRQYGVDYVYMGQLEQALYGPQAAEKYAGMADNGVLERVYQSGQTSIYRVSSPQSPPQTVTTALPVVAPPPLPEEASMLDRPVGMLPAVDEYAWNSLAQSEPVAMLLWLLALGAIGLLGLPLSVAVFGRWRDGGVTFAPLVGLLLLGYAVWLPVSAGVWQYDLRGMALGAALVLALNAALLWAIGRSGA
ncbi:MAG: hypothetical protein H7Z42_10835, partial [Roseiflexaceae bacterium]|nr:hypothetical protein [Roseiflexaceae bacterium]